jgi:hypothetical protein
MDKFPFIQYPLATPIHNKTVVRQLALSNGAVDIFLCPVVIAVLKQTEVTTRKVVKGIHGAEV